MSKKVHLIGIYGLYNFGCEAIVRGTYNLLKEVDPDIDITLHTHTPDYDKNVLKDLKISIEKIEYKRYKFLVQVLNRTLRFFSVTKQFSLEKISSYNDNDLFFSIGGDIYTIPKKDIAANIKYVKNDLVIKGDKLLKKSQMIIWGASIGPFGNNVNVNNYFFEHLKKMNSIFVREQRSKRLLEEHGIKKVYLTCDPAYFVESKFYKYDINKKTIGINFSPLSLKENAMDNEIEKYAKLIEKLISTFDVNIMLLPHVESPLALDDNDRVFQSCILDLITNKYKNRIKISENHSFLEIKKDICRCDLVISARMHCSINAISEYIPTIFVCYSQKGYGMCEFVYGSDKYAVDIKDIENNLIEVVEEVLNNNIEIGDYLSERVPEIRIQKAQIIEKLKEIIK